MVYIDVSRILIILGKTDLYTKYPVIYNNRDHFSKYLAKIFGHYYVYQRVGRRLNTWFRKYAIGSSVAYALGSGGAKKPIGDYLKQYCTKDSYQFYCFYLTDLKDYHFSKYLSKFFGKPIDNILEMFENLNLARDIPYVCKTKPEIKTAMEKIFNTYLIFTLARVFAQIDVALQSNTFDIFCCTGTGYPNLTPPLYQKIMNLAIKMDQQIDFEDDRMIKVSENMYVFMDKTVEITQMRIFLTEVYQNNKKLYQFFAEHTIDEILELCKKNPDMEAMVGRYYQGKKIVSKDFVIRCIANNHFWIINNILNNMCIYQDNEQVKGLRIHTKVPKKKIVIEV